MKDVAKIAVGDKVQFTVRASGKTLTDRITYIDDKKCMGRAYNLTDYMLRGELKKV
jgi:hypothetical protein